MTTSFKETIKSEITNLNNTETQNSNCRKDNWSKEDENMINKCILV